MIPKISAEDLKKMQDREGLVLQGCGGDLREWEDGIHQMLAEEKILQNGAHFKEIYAFEHDGCTNLLFMMDGIELDTGRLALWRLRTHAQFGGTWLSDYLPNRLGVEENVQNGKPDCPLIGANGNIFNLMGIAARTLAENDQNDEAKEMCALPGFVDSKNEEKTERNAGYLVVSQSGGGMLRQGTRKGIRRTPANRGMRAHRIVKSLDISEDVCHGLCP